MLDLPGDLMRECWVVGVAAEMAAADLRHPGGFAVGVQPFKSCNFAHGITRAADAAHPLIHEVILQPPPPLSSWVTTKA